MPNRTVSFTVGEICYSHPCRWTEGDIYFGDQEFSLQLDFMWVRERNDFSHHRLKLEVDDEFSADICIGLLQLGRHFGFRATIDRLLLRCYRSEDELSEIDKLEHLYLSGVSLCGQLPPVLKARTEISLKRLAKMERLGAVASRLQLISGKCEVEA